ncbi:hypothetical protein WA588_000393, partial [Blastocystis sp. NMH]
DQTKAPGVEKDPADSLPWVEKYRPSDLDSIASQKDIIATVKQFIEGHKLPHLLFYGPPGTGKTTTIMACAKMLYGTTHSNMVLELNASDDRGIDVVRDQIRNFAGTQKLFSNGIKLVVLDEADNMTNAAQFALRRIIEKYSQNTRFCLICNYVSEIIPALQSRCTRFRFQPLDPATIRDRLLSIIAQEKLEYTEDGVTALLDLSHGDMRRVINILQATAMAYGKITGENVYRSAGAPSPSDMEFVLHTLLNKPFGEALQLVGELKETKRFALQDILTELVKRLQEISFPPSAQIMLYKELAELEYRLTFGTQDDVQMASLMSIFVKLRGM